MNAITTARKSSTPTSTDVAPAPARGTWARALDDLDTAQALFATIGHWLDGNDEFRAEADTMGFALQHLYRAIEQLESLRDAATAAPAAQDQ